MNYDVQINNTIRKGLSYAELVALPIEHDTPVRREGGDWVAAKYCIELTHVLARRPSPDIPTIAPHLPSRPDYRSPQAEDRIFMPTAEYFKCKQKRKAAIIGICTLGLAGLSLMGVGNTWRSNIFAGTSLSANAGVGFVLQILSFCLLTALIAIPYFIYSVFALVYYSIRLSAHS